MKILNKNQEALLREERQLLQKLRLHLIRVGANQEDFQALDKSIQQLDEFFLLVVVGEFNSGKSAFINALLGQRVLKEGVTPTTTQVNVLRYGEKNDTKLVNENTLEITADAELLSEISIVDTPGTNAIIREHEQITSRFVPRSDLVLFITSADRPFTESERVFLEKIQNWGKKIVFVINKIDILQDETDLEQIKTFVIKNAQGYLGTTPDIFPVSARLAFKAKHGQPDLWDMSCFEALENYIHDNLDEASRLKLKFLNPLGVGKHITNLYFKLLQDRLELLKDDIDLIKNVEQQQDLYRRDMARDFGFRMSDIENILYEMEQRGLDYFDDIMRIGRVFDLLNKLKIQKRFESEVIMDVPAKIEQKVTDIIDWLVDSDLRQWQAVTEYIADRRRKHQERIIGDFGIGSFHYVRESLIEGIGREAKNVVETYDKTKEAAQIAQGAQNAVAASAALEISAVGLGALITAIATTVAADVTGILLASMIAALGLFIIPARRRQAKKELERKIADMRDQLIHSLNSHFEEEIKRSIRHMGETIAPYTRFVRSEQTKNLEAKNKLEEVKNELSRLEAKIEILPG